MAAVYSTFGELSIGDIFFFTRGKPGCLEKKTPTLAKSINRPYEYDNLTGNERVMIHPDSVKTET